MPAPSARLAVFITASGAEEAERLAESLVAERLAACVTRIPGAASVYRWHGAIERATEVLLIAKTRGALLRRLVARVRALHGYAVPEIVALPIVGGNPDYLRWLRAETREHRLTGIAGTRLRSRVR